MRVCSSRDPLSQAHTYKSIAPTCGQFLVTVIYFPSMLTTLFCSMYLSSRSILFSERTAVSFPLNGCGLRGQTEPRKADISEMPFPCHRWSACHSWEILISSKFVSNISLITRATLITGLDQVSHWNVLCISYWDSDQTIARYLVTLGHKLLCINIMLM